MTPNIDIIQITSLFGPFDHAMRHKNTFRTMHDGISSNLIAKQWG
jgi:hypothetical protein